MGKKSHKVFVAGDYVKDTIVVNSGNRLSTNLQYIDVHNRSLKIDVYHIDSGTRLLREVLSKDLHVELANTEENESPTQQTFSKWIEQRGKYYFAEQIGTDSSNESVENQGPTDLRGIDECNALAIYDSCGAIAQNETFWGKVCETDNLQDLIIRTSFTKRENNGTNVDKNDNQDNREKRLENTLISRFNASEYAKIREKTTLLYNVNELRRIGYNIKKGLSWEQLTTETIGAIENLLKGDYRQYKAIIICFNHEGCLLFNKGNWKLVCYKNEIEGDYILHIKKKAFAAIIVFQAYLTYRLLDNTHCDYEELLRNGLYRMRKTIEEGFGLDGNRLYISKNVFADSETSSEELTAYELDKDKLDSDFSFCKQTISAKKNDKRNENTNQNQDKGERQKDIFDLCKTIVRDGATKVKLPYLRIQNFLTFDRFEIEQMRSIRYLFEHYINDTKQDKPLSICVFGQPGAGKSFAVKQIAKDFGNQKIDTFEFNLSQMQSSKELFSAFHQIRDAGLKGHLPLAFFDEFDSSLNGSEFGWLKYFLSPMQDGEFRDEALPHFIGRAIFVFAGGTSESMESFKANADANAIVAKNAKVPDFLSRVKGYLDIKGLNSAPCVNKERPNDNCWYDSIRIRIHTDDESYCRNIDNYKFIQNKCTEDDKLQCCLEQTKYLRRATILRSSLERKMGKTNNDQIPIDDTVLDAFLKIEQYKNGARSLNAILDTSEFFDGKSFMSSCINTNYLDLHVTDDFVKYLNQ